MRIRRHFTSEGRSAFEGIAFRAATSEIRNPDGSVVFRQADIEVAKLKRQSKQAGLRPVSEFNHEIYELREND